MKLVRLISCIIVVLIFTIGCKEDSPSEPNETNNALISQSVGTEGGIVETDELSISIPGGSFSFETDVSITKAEKQSDYSDVSSTNWFTIEGIPVDYSLPINISLSVDDVPEGLPLIMISAPCFSTSVNSVRESFYFLEANYSEGKLNVAIPAVSNNGSLLKTNEGGKFSYTVWGSIKGYFGYTSINEHFYIIAKEGTSPLAVSNLGEYLEDAYTSIKSMGFDYSRRTAWPINVKIIKNLGIDGAYSASPFGINRDFIEIKSALLNDELTSKVTAGHEFFHFAQSMYEPFTQFNRGVDMIVDWASNQVTGSNKFKPKQLWLDEASAVWIETKFAKNADYISASYESAVHNMPFAGYKEIVDGNPASYGYGMFPFIKYLVKAEGEDVVKKAYDEIYKSAHPLTAISLASDGDLNNHWHTFIKELCAGEIVKDINLMQLKANAGSTEEKITSLDETDKTLNATLNELSAKIYYFPLDFTKTNDIVPIKFSVTKGAISVFKFANRSLDLLRHSKSIVSLPNLNLLKDEGARIYVVHSLGTISHPYTGSTAASLSYSIQAPQFDLSLYNEMHLTIVCRATRKNTAGDSDVRYEYPHSQNSVLRIDNFSGSFSDNTFSVDFMDQKGSWNAEIISASASASVDIANLKATNIKLDLNFKPKNNEFVEFKQQIHISELPFTEKYDYLKFSLRGADIGHVITSFMDREDEYPNLFIEYMDLKFDEDSYIGLTFYQR